MTGRHLDALFGNVERGYVEVRAVPSGEREWAEPGRWSQLGPFITAAVRARQEIYVGLATRRQPTCGTAENLADLSMLWIDLDMPPNEARTRLDAFPLPWALLVGSGCGCHAYFRLREPLDVSDAAECARAGSLMRRLAGYLGADARAAHVASVPRLAGTRNHKYGAPRPVALIAETDSALNPSELEDFLPAEIVQRNRLVLADALPIGARNDGLFRLIRSLRSKGLPMPVIADTVRTVNAKHTAEPLPEKELMTLLHHGMTYPDRPEFAPAPPRPVVRHRGTLR